MKNRKKEGRKEENQQLLDLIYKKNKFVLAHSAVQ